MCRQWDQEFGINWNQIRHTLTEKELFMLGFERGNKEEGAKILRPFRVLVHDHGNYTNLIFGTGNRRHLITLLCTRPAKSSSSNDQSCTGEAGGSLITLSKHELFAPSC